MKIDTNHLNRSEWMVAGSLAVVIAIVAVICLTGLVRYFSFGSQLADLEPRVARLEGLIAVDESIVEYRDQAGEELSDLVYSESEDSNAIAVRLQQNVRSYFSRAGMRVEGSQIQNVRNFEDFARIGISITAEGDLEALEQVLVDLTNRRPLIFIDDLEIKPKRRRNTETDQFIDAKIQLYAMKLQNG